MDGIGTDAILMGFWMENYYVLRYGVAQLDILASGTLDDGVNDNIIFHISMNRRRSSVRVFVGIKSSKNIVSSSIMIPQSQSCPSNNVLLIIAISTLSIRRHRSH